MVLTTKITSNIDDQKTGKRKKNLKKEKNIKTLKMVTQIYKIGKKKSPILNFISNFGGISTDYLIV